LIDFQFLFVHRHSSDVGLPFRLDARLLKNCSAFFSGWRGVFLRCPANYNSFSDFGFSWIVIFLGSTWSFLFQTGRHFHSSRFRIFFLPLLEEMVFKLRQYRKRCSPIPKSNQNSPIPQPFPLGADSFLADPIISKPHAAAPRSSNRTTLSPQISF